MLDKLIRESSSQPATLQELVSIEPGERDRSIQVTVKHVHEYRGSGLMEAFLMLLITILFLFGSIFMTVAAIHFYQGVQKHIQTSNAPL